jgi:hypothetical protein
MINETELHEIKERARLVMHVGAISQFEIMSTLKKTDISALIAEIRRLQEKLTTLHAAFASANERKYNRLPQPPEG